jgi:hypothetical protein
MNRARKVVCESVIIFCLMAMLAARADAQTSGSTSKVSPLQGPADLGIIFSTGNILLDLESYQGGLGAKIGWGNLCLRGVFDFLVNGASRSFSLNIGAAGEYHLAPAGPISPYIGGNAQIGYMYQGAVLSAFPFSVGAVAGVEVFIFDFLSVFAEYCLAFDFTVTTDLQTSQTTFDYLVDTRMGNSSKLGIVIYFKRVGNKRLIPVIKSK